MNQDILEAIKKSLPTIQVEALKIELDKAGKYDGLLVQKNELSVQLNDAKHKISQLESQVKKDVDLQAREIKLEVELLKKDLACAKEVILAVKELSMAAFRNPAVHKSYNRHVGVPSGGYTSTVNESEYITQE